jgi:cystathionine beta-synthase
MEVHENVLETVGGTPLVRINAITKEVKPEVYAKLEYFNPGGSVKDRIAISIIEDAEKKGLLKKGGTIIEATSGNTGVGLALVASVRGYKTIFTIPDKMSKEKINLLKAFGAEVIVTPTAVPPDHPDSYYEVAKKLVRETPNSFYANQYYNKKNPEAHYKTTGPEIWEQTDGKVTHLVAGAGTGGTISGIAKFLKKKNPDIKVIAVDPKGSVFKDYFETGKMGEAHTYKIEGIGEDILPETMNFDYVDKIIRVGDKESFLMARRLAREEGIFAGGSSGSAMVGVMKIAKDLDKDSFIVVIFPDTGSRYLTKIFNDDWMKENGFLDEVK